MPTIYDFESKVFPGEASVFLADYNCADLHQRLEKHLISPLPFSTKLCPLRQHRLTIVSLHYDKEYTDKWRLVPDNGFSIASVGSRLGEGGTVFWQIASDSSGYRHPLSCSLLGFPPPHHSRGALQSARSQWAGPTLRFQMLANLSEGTGVPSVCLWSRSRGGSMGKGSHRRGSTPADR